MIEVDHLSRRYGDLVAVDRLSLTVPTGEVMGLLGPNGAGKTTTLRMLCGCLGPSEGTARIAGFDIARESRRARAAVGYLPEQPPLYDEMTVGGFIDHAARLRRVPARARAAAVARALALADLEGVRKRIIGHLSKGFRQRVGLAQALVHSPPVLVLDEPTSGLDPAQMASMRSLILGLRGAQTILLSTHLLGEATSLCDRVSILVGGQLVAAGTESELRAQLGADRVIRIEVTGSPDACVSALQAVPEATAASIDPSGAVRVTLRDDADTTRAAVNAVAARFGLLSSRPAEGLEDLFLRAVSSVTTR